MKKILLFAFFNLFSAFSFIVFILEFSKHCEIAFLIPALLCFLISFVYDKKRYYIELNDENKENIQQLAEGKEYIEKNNLWYYLIEIFGWC